MHVSITDSTALRILDVGGSKIGDVGMEILVEALQYKNSLTDLRMWKCGLSVKSKCCDYLNSMSGMKLFTANF